MFQHNALLSYALTYSVLGTKLPCYFPPGRFAEPINIDLIIYLYIYIYTVLVCMVAISFATLGGPWRARLILGVIINRNIGNIEALNTHGAHIRLHPYKKNPGMSSSLKVGGAAARGQPRRTASTRTLTRCMLEDWHLEAPYECEQAACIYRALRSRVGGGHLRTTWCSSWKTTAHARGRRSRSPQRRSRSHSRQSEKTSIGKRTVT